VLALEFIDKRVRGAQDLHDVLGVPVLGVLQQAEVMGASRWNFILRFLRRKKTRFQAA
jgi:hypothetical protein